MLTLITLAVKTNAFARDLRHPIPETSYYHAIRDFIHGITDGRLQKSGISTTQYATSVVDEVERGSSGTVWVGASAFAARWGWALSPRFVRVSSCFLGRRNFALGFVPVFPVAAL